jgi:hypothetical protein
MSSSNLSLCESSHNAKPERAGISDSVVSQFIKDGYGKYYLVYPSGRLQPEGGPDDIVLNYVDEDGMDFSLQLDDVRVCRFKRKTLVDDRDTFKRPRCASELPDECRSLVNMCCDFGGFMPVKPLRPSSQLPNINVLRQDMSEFRDGMQSLDQAVAKTVYESLVHCLDSIPTLSSFDGCRKIIAEYATYSSQAFVKSDLQLQRDYFAKFDHLYPMVRSVNDTAVELLRSGLEINPGPDQRPGFGPWLDHQVSGGHDIYIPSHGLSSDDTTMVHSRNYYREATGSRISDPDAKGVFGRVHDKLSGVEYSHSPSWKNEAIVKRFIKSKPPTHLQVKLGLVQGGVETNPGPPKKNPAHPKKSNTIAKAKHKTPKRATSAAVTKTARDFNAMSRGNPYGVRAPGKSNHGKTRFVRKREFCVQILGTASSFDNMDYQLGGVSGPHFLGINPGNGFLFSWLPTVAGGFEFYKFHHLRFFYESSVTQGSGSINLSAGKVMYNIDYDSSNAPASSYAIMEANDNVAEGPPALWTSTTLKTTKLGPRMGSWHVRSNGIVAANTDVTLYDPGFLNIVTTNNTQTGEMGNLYCDYDVEFFKPIANPFTTGPIQHYEWAGATVNAPLGTAGLLAPLGGGANAYAYQATLSGGGVSNVTFIMQYSGTYFLTASFGSGSAAITALPTISKGSGISFNNFFASLGSSGYVALYGTPTGGGNASAMIMSCFTVKVDATSYITTAPNNMAFLGLTGMAASAVDMWISPMPLALVNVDLQMQEALNMKTIKVMYDNLAEKGLVQPLARTDRAPDLHWRPAHRLCDEDNKHVVDPPIVDNDCVHVEQSLPNTPVAAPATLVSLLKRFTPYELERKLNS